MSFCAALHLPWPYNGSLQMPTFWVAWNVVRDQLSQILTISCPLLSSNIQQVLPFDLLLSVRTSECLQSSYVTWFSQTNIIVKPLFTWFYSGLFFSWLCRSSDIKSLGVLIRRRRLGPRQFDVGFVVDKVDLRFILPRVLRLFPYNPYPTAFPYGNGMFLHFYQQQESSTTETVHRVINKGLKAYV